MLRRRRRQPWLGPTPSSATPSLRTQVASRSRVLLYGVFNSRAEAVAAAAVEIDAWRLVSDPQRVDEIVALGDFERRLAEIRGNYGAMVEKVAAMSNILKQHGIPEPGER